MTKYYFIFFLFIFNIYCNHKTRTDKSHLHTKLFVEWRHDSLGCLGYRSRIISDSINAIRKFEGSSYTTFTEYFGMPFTSRKGSINIKHFYRIDCSIFPPIKNGKDTKSEVVETNSQVAETPSEGAEMCVEVNKQNIVYEISITIP